MTRMIARRPVWTCALLCLLLAACASDDTEPSGDDEDSAVIESPGDGGSDDGGGHTAADCQLPVQGGVCDGYFPRYAFMPNGRCGRFIYGGCGGNANNFATLEECEATCEPECSVDATDDSLPGVTVHVEGDACTVVAGEDSVFRYRIEIEQPIDYVQPASVGCGPCGDSPVSYRIGQGLVFYALLDVGCCPPVDEERKTLPAEPITGAIEWPGVQWRGPSDTVEPLGPPFPHGEYAVSVTIEVPGKGAIIAELPITVLAADPLNEGRPCMAATYAYPSGDATFPDPTSCNTCLCEDGMVTACTEIGCERPCNDGFTSATDCAECSQLSMGCGIPRTACLPACAAGDACGNGASCDDGACRVLCD